MQVLILCIYKPFYTFFFQKINFFGNLHLYALMHLWTETFTNNSIENKVIKINIIWEECKINMERVQSVVSLGGSKVRNSAQINQLTSALIQETPDAREKLHSCCAN